MAYGDDGHTRYITVFAKPPRIDIPTPYKIYNPDFAYVISNGGGKALFLVVETKGYDNHADIPEDERQKIKYGRKFFESLRKVLSGGVELCFPERLNRDMGWRTYSAGVLYAMIPRPQNDTDSASWTDQ